jgi:hypothetical protein
VLKDRNRVDVDGDREEDDFSNSDTDGYAHAHGNNGNNGNGNGNGNNGQPGDAIGLSDDDSVITEDAHGDTFNVDESTDLKPFGGGGSMIDGSSVDRAGVTPMDSTFSADIERGAAAKHPPHEVIEEETPSPNRGNITYLSDEEGNDKPEEAKDAMDAKSDKHTSSTVSNAAPNTATTTTKDDVPATASEAEDDGADAGAAQKSTPVAAGSGYTFAKKQSASNLLKEKEGGAETKESEAAAAAENVEAKADANASAGCVEEKQEDYEYILREHACVINEDVILVKIYSNETTGATTLRAFNDKGEKTLTYQLIPALASQLKELSNEETNVFLTDMLNTTLLIPSEQNMSTEYKKDAAGSNKASADADADGDGDGGVSGQSEKSVAPDTIYEVSIGEARYSSRLEFKEEGTVEIHASNMENGKHHIIPLLPVLAKQIASLTYDQISGVIKDIIKTFSA